MNRANVIEENINRKNGITKTTLTMVNGDIYEEVSDTNNPKISHIYNTLNGVKHGIECWRWSISYFHKMFYEHGRLVKEETFDNKVFKRVEYNDEGVVEEIKPFPRLVDNH